MIYLKYGNFTGTTLNWGSSQSFNELKLTGRSETQRSSGRSLRGIEFSHHHSRRAIWNLVISADELSTTANYDFIKAFFEADCWKFSLDDWTSETEVVIENSGQMPLEFLENNKHFPEVNLLLIQKYPD